MSSEPITVLLREFAGGDRSALDRLMPLIYEELRRLADRHLNRERTGHTLQPTALVHEAWVRMIGREQPDYRSRAHFLGVAARQMRQVLIDHARTRNARKRGRRRAGLHAGRSHRRRRGAAGKYHRRR